MNYLLQNRQFGGMVHQMLKNHTLSHVLTEFLTYFMTWDMDSDLTSDSRWRTGPPILCEKNTFRDDDWLTTHNDQQYCRKWQYGSPLIKSARSTPPVFCLRHPEGSQEGRGGNKGAPTLEFPLKRRIRLDKYWWNGIVMCFRCQVVSMTHGQDTCRVVLTRM